jgi:hypothetical protein
MMLFRQQFWLYALTRLCLILNNVTKGINYVQIFKENWYSSGHGYYSFEHSASG